MMCNVEPFKGGGRGSNVAYIHSYYITDARTCAVVFMCIYTCIY